MFRVQFQCFFIFFLLKSLLWHFVNIKRKLMKRLRNIQKRSFLILYRGRMSKLGLSCWFGWYLMLCLVCFMFLVLLMKRICSCLRFFIFWVIIFVFCSFVRFRPILWKTNAVLTAASMIGDILWCLPPCFLFVIFTAGACFLPHAWYWFDGKLSMLCIRSVSGAVRIKSYNVLIAKIRFVIWKID